jgi:thioredoxin-like negative regulator of GroEL
MDKLVKAWMLAPQVTEVVLDTAVALSHAGRLEEAARVLEPLAWSPHAGPAAELAARMLARARQGDKAGLLAEVSALRVRQQALAAAMRVRPVSGQR